VTPPAELDDHEREAPRGGSQLAVGRLQVAAALLAGTKLAMAVVADPHSNCYSSMCSLVETCVRGHLEDDVLVDTCSACCGMFHSAVYELDCTLGTSHMRQGSRQVTSPLLAMGVEAW
jgi:hypothetical protein